MPETTPYLLDLCSSTPGWERYNASLKNIDCEHVTVHFNKFPGHIEKWRHLPCLNPSKYVIFSDTDDVIFQTALPTFTHDLYLAPENVLHRDTMWKEHIEWFPAFAPLMEKEVFNCGTFAMKVKTLYEYQRFLMEFPDDGYRQLGLEQMYFNMFVYTRKDLSRVIDRTIFCPLFANVHHGVKKENEVWTDGEKTICCVHANGDVALKGQL